MFKSLFFFVFIVSPFIAFEQTQKVTFTISSTGENCTSLKKEMTLSLVVNGEDSLVKKQVFTNCTTEAEFSKKNGKYHLVIEVEKYEDLNISFDVTEASPEVIDLKTIELRKKSRQLDEFTVSGIKRSYIQIDADKTTINVKDNAVLTKSSLYDAILRIPGVVPYPGGGFTIGGKNASVYFEGIPSNMSNDDLTNLLKSLPATSVEKIEIISNPGAAYDANVSGAIINVITTSRANKWFSGTLTLNYGLNANNKILPSLSLSGRNTKYSWQLQTGYSYFEKSYRSASTRSFTTFDPIAQLIMDKREQNASSFYYFKPSVNYKLNKKSSISLNYNGSFRKGSNVGNAVSSSQEIAPAVNLSNQYEAKTAGLNNELILKYQTKLDTLKRLFSVTAYYSDYVVDRMNRSSQRMNEVSDYSVLKYALRLKQFYTRADVEIPFEKQKFYLSSGIKYRKMFANSLGEYNLQNPNDAIFQDPIFNSGLAFDYEEDNLAGYVEMKKGFGKKLSIGAGIRLENFNLKRRSTVTDSKANNYFNPFPSFNAIYRFSPDINLIANYSRKISIPSYNQFDPNNNGYYDSYSSETGNILLSPNFYDNAQLKFTVFDYLQLSVNYSHSQTLNLFELTAVPNSLQTVQTFRSYHNVNSLTYFFSLPVPFGMFKDGLAFFNSVIDIDQINFMYLYAERTKTTIGDFNYLSENKARWSYGVYSQFILPWKIRMNVDYYISTRGMYQLYNFTKPTSELEVVFSREFMQKKLKASVSFQDIFNTSQATLRTSFENVNMDHYSKDDTRIVWFKLSWSFGQYEKQGSDLDIDKGGKTPDLNDGLK